MFRLSTAGMGASLLGLVILAFATHYWLLLVAAMSIGLGSSIFHPDSSRVARTASGGRYGFAQSLFQVGGNTGSALGPLLAAFVVLPFGQPSIAWFSVLAFIAMLLLWNVGTWARAQHQRRSAVRPDRRAGGVGAAAAAGDRGDRRARGSRLLEVHLPDEPDELLHLLPDRALRRQRAGRAAPALRLPRRRRRRHLRRRPGRRPGRAQGGDLGLDPRRAAVLAGAPLRRPVLDGGPERDHRRW